MLLAISAENVDALLDSMDGQTLGKLLNSVTPEVSS